MSKSVLVLGASENPSRYSNMAVKKLKAYGHHVTAVGRRVGEIAGIPISKEPVTVNGVDTITLYLNPDNQVPFYDYIISAKPKRIIFNPGTENDELISKAEENGIESVEGCTLVMLSTGQF